MSPRSAFALLGALSCAALLAAPTLGGARALAAPPDAGPSGPTKAAPVPAQAPPAAAPSPATPAPNTPPKNGTPSRLSPPPLSPTKPNTKRAPAALPDGTFVGSLRAGERRWPLRLTVVAGMVVFAEVGRGAEAKPLALRASGAPDATALRLTGRQGSDYLQLRGAFFDIERGAGRFDGTFARKRIGGTWVLARR